MASRAQGPIETCADVLSTDPANSTAVPTALTQLPDKSYRVEVHFLPASAGDPSSDWTATEKQYVCAAARHVQAVFSSKEFYDAFTNLPDLVLNKYGFWHKNTDTITSTDLYANLTRQSIIVMQVGITDKDIQCARTVIADQGPTRLDKEYVDSSKTSCGGPLLAALTNSLAHEYTHYNSRYISYDNHVVNDRTYVSYGVGCLVQNLAFQNHTCWYDPRLTPPQPPQSPNVR